MDKTSRTGTVADLLAMLETISIAQMRSELAAMDEVSREKLLRLLDTLQFEAERP